MKLITRNSDYAIRAVAAIAKQNGATVSIPELVKATKVPRPFLRKILQELSRGGVLSSVRGKSGGFKLHKPPGVTRILDIMRIFQGPFMINECFFKKDICPNIKKCALKKKIDEVEKYVLTRLSSFTIKDMLEE